LNHEVLASKLVCKKRLDDKTINYKQ